MYTNRAAGRHRAYIFKNKKTQIILATLRKLERYTKSNKRNIMTEYVEVKILLTQAQQTKLRMGIEHDEEVVLQVKKENVDHPGGSTLKLTRSQLGRLNQLEDGKSARLTFSKTQLKSIKDTRTRVKKVTDALVELSLTPLEVERVKKVRFDDNPEVYEFKGDGIASLVLPFVKNVLPKVLGTLGLAAATGSC